MPPPDLQEEPPGRPLDPVTRLDHVRLRVADRARAVAFYRDLLGFRVLRDGPRALHAPLRVPPNPY